ncbi:antitoxin [Saccharomonospora piscinae]|uniref:antitoxin n=1 Tax=Saccharomonospora piscinae TaxID=687388 RepID=UPI000466A42E|nr:antitoxin [Saccharomonospora piscinae]
MGINFNELRHKAQDALSKNSGKIEQGLDKASGMAKSRFGKQSGKIDTATEKAKNFLHKNSGGGDSGGQPGQRPPQPPPGP